MMIWFVVKISISLFFYSNQMWNKNDSVKKILSADVKSFETTSQIGEQFLVFEKTFAHALGAFIIRGNRTVFLQVIRRHTAVFEAVGNGVNIRRAQQARVTGGAGFIVFAR